MLDISLIGLGNMGSLHLKNIKSLEKTGLCRLSSICDTKHELADNISEQLQIPGYYSIEDLLDNGAVDAAIIATTTSSHLHVARQLIEKNIPVLIEKPVVVSINEAQELMELALKHNVLISAGYTELYNSVTKGAASIFKEKPNFYYMDFFRIGQRSMRNNSKDIDVVHDLMVHDVAVLSQFIDLKDIKDVSGYFSSYNENSEKFDMACVNLILSGDRAVRFLCDRNGTTKIRKFSLSMDDMYGEFDYMDQTAQVYKKGKLEAFGDNIWYTQSYDGAKIRYSNNPLMDEIMDFITAAEHKKGTLTASCWYDVTVTIERIREVLYDKLKRSRL